MKTVCMWSLVIISVIFLTQSFALATQAPMLQTYQLTTGYIPIGFDDNDNIQVTVEGYLPSTCFRVATTAIEFMAPSIVLKQYVYKYPGPCLDMLVPFHETVNLGIMPQGVYQVVDSVSGKNLGTLPVTKARSDNADDYLYAPVSDAFLVENGGQFGVALNGVFTDACVHFTNFATKVFGNVIEVLPITEHAQLNTCNRGFFPFQKNSAFPKPAPGHYLLHVRSLEGQAINKMVDVN